MRLHPLFATLALASSPAAQDVLFSHPGSQAGHRHGFAVGGVGDLNKDGWGDYIVGVPGAADKGRDSGKALVLSGRDGTLLFEVVGEGAGDQLGWSVGGAGDTNKDGVPDVVVGAPFDDDKGTNAGSARVHSGKDGSLLLRLQPDGQFEIFGVSVAAAGDVNDDGFDDVIVGSHGTNLNGGNSGAARVFSGKDGRRLHLFVGDSAFDFFGHTVGGVGDLNRDGHDDVIVGAPDDDNNGRESGMARVFCGKSGKTLFQLDGDGVDDFFGHSVAGAGDVNKDGTPDFIIGANEFFGVRPGRGYARIHSGTDGKVLHSFRGDKDGDFFGEPVRGIGDVDNDGHADAVIGAHRSDANGTDSGLVKVFSGKAGALLYTLPGPRAGARFGYFCDGAGTVNRDSTPDLIVGAPEDPGAGVSAGLAQVFSGRSLSFYTDVHTVSLGSGGTQVMRLRAGPQFKNLLYIVLGSAKSTSNGFEIPGGIVFPLDFDFYMMFTLTGHGTLILNSLSALDGNGEATARFVLPKGHPASLAGLFLRHAYLVMDLSGPKVVFASNARPVTLVR